MPSRLLSPAKAEEYRLLKCFLEVYFKEYPVENAFPDGSFPAYHHPLRLLDRMFEQSPSMALQGVRMAVSDTVEGAQDLKGAPLAHLDACLRGAGAPTMSEMRSKLTRQVLKILRKRKAADADECRLLQAALGDVDSAWLTAAMREEGERILNGSATTWYSSS